ncbi:MAG: hypothetical protein ACT4NJ_04845 [Nitrosopumilaceae archaeon]
MSGIRPYFNSWKKLKIILRGFDEFLSSSAKAKVIDVATPTVNAITIAKRILDFCLIKEQKSLFY